METNPNLANNHSISLNEITKSFEKLLNETQCDIEIFRHEQQHLKQKIREIVAENNSFNSKLDEIKSGVTTNSAPITTVGDSWDDGTREKFSNEAFENVKKQIDYLQEENNSLRSIKAVLQEAVANLEEEINVYRSQIFEPTSACEVKQKYTNVIKLLEAKILYQQSESKKQSQIIEKLYQEKKNFNEHISNLERSIEEKDKEIAKLPETTAIITNLQEQLTQTLRRNNDLQKSLKILQQSKEETIKREESLLQKVQEALTLAEAAVADKNEAQMRERIVKEECDTIASTIGIVMDEASRKVEKDMATLRNKYIDNEKSLTKEIKKLSEVIDNQKKYNEILDKRCNRFEQKYKDAMKENENLSHLFKEATKVLHKMEERLKSQDLMIKNELTLQKSADEDHQKEIQQFINNNKLLKESYHVALMENTKQFKTEIIRLQSEVAKLKDENQQLKLQNIKKNQELK